MPELPEVETLVRGLTPRLTERRINGITVLWPPTVYKQTSVYRDLLSGTAIRRVFRRGKYICLVLDSGWTLSIHLRMTGKLLFQLSPELMPFLRVSLQLAEQTVYFVDVRKFGRMKLWPPGAQLLPDLGPDALDTPAVRKALKQTSSSRAIKCLLLDQHVIAGIGNIYADESLFAARISPITPAFSLSSHQAARLARAIHAVLQAAIAHSGTSLKDYRTADGDSGRFQHRLQVYGRAGKPCYACGTPIERVRLQQRSCHFCPSCQRGRSRNSR